MPKSSKPRKAHRQKKSIPVTHRFNSEDERTMQLVPHVDLEAIRDGRAGGAEWDTITCRLNWGRVLAERHSTAASVLIMEASLDAMVACKVRHERIGKLGLSGDEFVAVGAGLNQSDTLQLTCTKRQLRDALLHVFANATEAKTGILAMAQTAPAA